MRVRTACSTYLKTLTFSTKEKKFYQEAILKMIKGTFYRQTQFAEFEMTLHDEVESGGALLGRELERPEADEVDDVESATHRFEDQLGGACDQTFIGLGGDLLRVAVDEVFEHPFGALAIDVELEEIGFGTVHESLGFLDRGGLSECGQSEYCDEKQAGHMFEF